MKKLILASSSYTRKRILTEAGLDFEIDSPNFEEDMTLPMAPEELVIFLSQGKAKDVATRHKNALVLGADTVIFYQNERLGKPHTKERATEMLKMLSGKQHSAMTGFTLIDTGTGKTVSKTVETKVFFKNLTDKEINDYVATGEPLDKAGAYGILENGMKLMEKVEGSITNVAGLPVEEFLATLSTF